MNTFIKNLINNSYTRHVLCIAVTAHLYSCNKNDTPKPDTSGLFIKYFGTAKNDAGFAVKQTADGGFILVGSSISDGRQDSDVLLVKTDANGNKIWEQRYGNNYNQAGMDVAISSSGNYYVAGYTTNDKDSTDCLVLEFNSGGVLQKSFSFGAGDRNERARFIRISSDGSLFTAGTRQQGGGNQLNMYAGKTDMNTLLFEKEIGLATLFDDIGSIAEASNQEYIWCGTVSRGSETDLRICKTDAFANLIWDYSIGEADGINQTGKEVQATNDGNFIIGGSQTNSGNITPLVAKVNIFGTLLWSRTPGDGGSAYNSIYPTNDDGFIAAGSNNGNFLIAKLNSLGLPEWEEIYGAAGTNQANRVIQTSDGGYLASGTFFIANNTTIGIVKTDKEGKITTKK